MKLSKIIVVFFLLAFYANSFSQGIEVSPNHYLIYFADKNHSNYTFLYKNHYQL